jgi:hypothetical protein
VVRRWYISLPAFMASLAVAAAGYAATPVHNQSNAVLVLTAPLSGPTTATDPSHPYPLTNPLLSFNGSLTLTATLLGQQLNSPSTARTLGVVPGGATGYEVTDGNTNPETLQPRPFVFIVGTGPSPESAQEMAQRVSAAAAAILSTRQAQVGAPMPTRIGLQVVVAPTEGLPLTGSRKRAAAATCALAGLLSLAAVYGFESAMSHARRRKAHQKAGANASHPEVGLLSGADERSTVSAVSDSDGSPGPDRRPELVRPASTSVKQ